MTAVVTDSSRLSFRDEKLDFIINCDTKCRMGDALNGVEAS